MDGILGLFLLIALVIAAGIASMTGRNGPPSAGRFFLRFIIALVGVIFVAALLLFGACALMFGGYSGGCINC
ncbi:MAG TPA: hypothetical protein VJV39_15040 [Dongiaceae bacterium]|nr:hypothetical protein [Dongiaceae bacterium]